MKRFETLDGLRGVAALLVVSLHATGLLFPESGYLAVDFFFMLSGFILAAVYEPRFARRMTARQFGLVRFRFLYPTMAFGVLLGAAVAWLGGMPAGELVGHLVRQLLFLPTLGADIAYPLNAVQWSLGFEFLLNAFHVLLFWKLSNGKLAALAGLFLVLLVLTAVDQGNLAMGDRGYSLPGGFARSLFPYLVGILIFRFRDRLPRVQAPSWIFLVALAAIIIGADVAKIAVEAWIVDLFVVVLAFPPLLHLASYGFGMARACAILGAISFPLYALHVPIVVGLAAVLPEGIAMVFVAFLLSSLLALALARRPLFTAAPSKAI